MKASSREMLTTDFRYYSHVVWEIIDIRSLVSKSSASLRSKLLNRDCGMVVMPDPKPVAIYKYGRHFKDQGSMVHDGFSTEIRLYMLLFSKVLTVIFFLVESL